LSQHRRLNYFLVQALTLGRVPLILVFLVVTLLVDTRSSVPWFTVAFGAMVLSALTDCFDGYLARKLKVETRLGAFMDPLTDKIYYLVTFPTLVFLACSPREMEGTLGDPGAAFHPKLLLVLTVLFLLRDQWVSFLRAIGSEHNIDVKANWSGKARTLIAFPVICAVYYYLQAPMDSIYSAIPLYRWPHLIYGIEGLCLVINLISLWVYTARFWPALKKEMAQGWRE
jgi:CDP-diacylglycerol--glycerol-3-phosphate 3-phosphatidyltransferase